MSLPADARVILNGVWLLPILLEEGCGSDGVVATVLRAPEVCEAGADGVCEEETTGDARAAV